MRTILAQLGINGGLSSEQRHDVGVAVAQSTPGAVASAGTHIAGLPLSDWAVVATILFVLLQVGHLIWKWRRDARREDERQEDRRAGRRGPDLDEMGADE